MLHSKVLCFGRNGNRSFLHIFIIFYDITAMYGNFRMTPVSVAIVRHGIIGGKIFTKGCIKRKNRRVGFVIGHKSQPYLSKRVTMGILILFGFFCNILLQFHEKYRCHRATKDNKPLGKRKSGNLKNSLEPRLRNYGQL